LSFIFPLKNRK